MSPVSVNPATSVKAGGNLRQHRHRPFRPSGGSLHGDLGMLDSRDVMLFISYSGSAKELDLIVPRLEEKGIPLLAMTGKSTSPLALAAAVLDIAVGARPARCIWRQPPAPSTR